MSALFQTCLKEVVIDHSFADVLPLIDALEEPVVELPASEHSLPAMETLEDVRRAIELHVGLTLQHRRDLTTALRKLAGLLDRDLTLIPADPASLRVLMERIYPAAHGMKPHRWRNLRSLVLRALQLVGVAARCSRATTPLTPAWKVLHDQLTPQKHRKHKIGLSSFLHFCSEQDVAPTAVTLDTFAAFEDALIHQGLRGKPEQLFRQICRLWNQVAGTVEGWPNLQVPVAGSTRCYAPDISVYPASFQQDVEAFLSQRANPDPLSDDYAAPLRPSTLQHRRTQIRRIAAAVVSTGVAIEDVISLAVLVEEKNAKAALRFFVDRAGAEKKPWVAEMAMLMKIIAKDWVKAPPAQVLGLGRFTKNLSPKRRGMTERNRSRLRQFDSPEAVLALLRLPRKLMKAVDAVDDGSLAMAQRAMFAMALEMFIVAPMRMNNLAGITIDGHLIRSTIGRHSAMHVVVPADEMKNGEPMELALPADTAAMLSIFLKRYHPRLSPEPSIWLFPTSKGTRRSNTPFSRALSLLIKRETGIVMHMHLFRHLAIKLHLSSNPDDIETGRRLLGHKNSSTTTRFYADFKTDSAFKRFDELIASLRDLPSMPPPRAGKGGRS